MEASFIPKHTPPQLNQNALAVVDLMLDDLRRPAGEGFESHLERFRLILHLD